MAVATSSVDTNTHTPKLLLYTKNSGLEDQIHDYRRITGVIPQILQLQAQVNAWKPRLMSQVRRVRKVVCAHVRLVLDVVMQNDRDFPDVILI
jgi:hypothetical protein